MSTISASRTIPAPVDIVFDEYTDHERLSDLPLVISAKLIREGATDKNGLGAVRRVNAGLMQLQEEVTVFDRPHLMEYRITWSFPRVQHDLGRVEFTSVPGGTEVSWTSVSSLRLLGGRLDPILAPLFAFLFRTTLRQVEKRSLARRAPDSPAASPRASNRRVEAHSASTKRKVAGSPSALGTRDA